MKEKQELDLLTNLQRDIDQVLDQIYVLVGDKGMPDEDVKTYFDPYFRTTTALRFYLKDRVKKLDSQS